MDKRKYGADSATKKDYNSKYLYFVGFKLFKAHDSRKCDQDIIDFLQTQPNKSDIIKQALREYMERHKEEEDMKKYTVLPEYRDLWSNDPEWDGTVDEKEIKRLASEWGKTVEELMEQVEEA